LKNSVLRDNIFHGVTSVPLHKSEERGTG